MYRQGVLEQKFDIYDFAEKNTKREIDIDDEGYEIISEAKKWFKDYEIPNLKKVITMGCISKKAVEVLKNQGIEVEE